MFGASPTPSKKKKPNPPSTVLASPAPIAASTSSQIGTPVQRVVAASVPSKSSRKPSEATTLDIREHAIPAFMRDALVALPKTERILPIDIGWTVVAIDNGRVMLCQFADSLEASTTILDLGDKQEHMSLWSRVSETGLAVVLESNALILWNDPIGATSTTLRLHLPSESGRASAIARIGRSVYIATDLGRLLQVDSDAERVVLRQTPTATPAASWGLLGNIGALLWRTPNAAASSTTSSSSNTHASALGEIRCCLGVDRTRVLTLTHDALQLWRVENDAGARGVPTISDNVRVGDAIRHLLGL
jgi:hypothetical protein